MEKNTSLLEKIEMGSFRGDKTKKKIEKFWDKVFKPDGLHPPEYCPNCGAKLTRDFIPFWNDSSRRETPQDPYKEIGYDTYCSNCDWSGDIIPDADRNVIHNVDENGKEYEVAGKDWHRKEDC